MNSAEDAAARELLVVLIVMLHENLATTVNGGTLLTSHG